LSIKCDNGLEFSNKNLGAKKKRGKVVIRFLLAGNENDCKNYNNANVSKNFQRIEI